MTLDDPEELYVKFWLAFFVPATLLAGRQISLLTDIRTMTYE